TILLVAFVGAALADGPHGYNMEYHNNYGDNQRYGNYSGYQMYPNYSGYNYCNCYVYNPCPYTNYGYSQKRYSIGGKKSYGGYASYGGYSMNYSQYGGYGW